MGYEKKAEANIARAGAEKKTQKDHTTKAKKTTHTHTLSTHTRYLPSKKNERKRAK